MNQKAKLLFFGLVFGLLSLISIGNKTEAINPSNPVTITRAYSCPPQGTPCTRDGTIAPGFVLIVDGSGFTSSGLAKPIVKIGNTTLTVSTNLLRNDSLEANIPNNIGSGTQTITVAAGRTSATYNVSIVAAPTVPPPSGGGGAGSGGGGGGGSTGGNFQLLASPATFRVGENYHDVRFQLSGGPSNGRFCVSLFGTCAANAANISAPLGPTGLGTLSLRISGQQNTATIVYKAVIFDSRGVQVGTADSNQLTFTNNTTGGGGGGGGGNCDPVANPGGCGNTGGGGGAGGGDPDGLIGSGIKGLKDRFNTSGTITGSTSVGELINNVIEVILGLVLAVALLMVIIGGYFYITAAGNDKQAERGKKTVTYAIIGIAIVMLSYTVIFVINEFLIAG